MNSKQIRVGDLTFQTFQDKTEYLVGRAKYAASETGSPGEKVSYAWRWHCKAANGKKVCTSGESFASKGNAERAMNSFITGVRYGVPPYVKDNDDIF